LRVDRVEHGEPSVLSLGSKRIRLLDRMQQDTYRVDEETRRRSHFGGVCDRVVEGIVRWICIEEVDGVEWERKSCESIPSSIE